MKKTNLSKYYYKRDEDTGVCLEPCSLTDFYKIGSLACSLCEHNEGSSRIGTKRPWIRCSVIRNDK